MPEEKKEKKKSKLDLLLNLFIIIVLLVGLALIALRQTRPRPAEPEAVVNEFVNTLERAEGVKESEDYKELIISAGDKTEVAYRVDEQTEIYGMSDLSPNQKEILTILKPIYGIEYNDEDYGITIFNLESKEKKIITTGSGFGMGAQWSPNGKYIAYDIEGALNSDNYGVWLYDIDSGKNEHISPTTEDSASFVLWSISGEEVSYWVSYGHGDGEYFAINIFTKEIREIEEDELNDATKWQQR